MSVELDNIDELEALLAELDDLEEKPVPVRQQAGSKAKKPEPAEELSDDDLSELEELELATAVEARKDVPDEELGSLDDLENSISEFESALDDTLAAAEKVVGGPAVEEKIVGAEITGVVLDELADIEGLDAVLAEVDSDAAAKLAEVPAPASSPAVEAVRSRRVKSGETASPVTTATKLTKPKTAYVEEDEDEEPGFLTPSLKTFIDPDQLQGDLEISESNLSKAMIRQAPLFARYSALAAKAQFQADRADQQVDLVEAELDSDIRDDMNAKGVKITESMVKAAVIRHPKYQKAVTRYNEAKAIAEMVKTAADSFRHRRDMLIQMGADRREEMKGAVRVQEHPGSAALRTINGEK